MTDTAPAEEAKEEVAFDMDAVRAAYIEEHPIEFTTLGLYGQVWHIKPDPNLVATLDLIGDDTQQLDFFISYVKGDEQDKLRDLMKKDDFMDQDQLAKLLDWLTTRTVARPTEPSSSSEPGSPETGSGLKDGTSTPVPTVDSPTSASERD